MLIKKSGQISESMVTDEAVYHSRRQFLKGGLLAAGAAALPGLAFGRDILTSTAAQRPIPDFLKAKLQSTKPGKYSTNETPTPWSDVTQYNNFYEFGTNKGDPAENAQNFSTDPWTVEIAGEADITGKFDLEDILKPHDLEERIYRLRCV